jgi:hypothetical protein
MTEQECIKWVQEHLPFAMRSKKGKVVYPFKAARYAREIEERLGKDLYELLNQKP